MSSPSPDVVSTADRAQLNAFKGALYDVREHFDDIDRLMDEMPAIIDAVEWGLFNAPRTLDCAWLAPVSEGLLELIQAAAEVADQADAHESYTSESIAAIQHLCAWQSNLSAIRRNWIQGWSAHQGEKTSVVRLFVDELSASARLPYFVSRLTWLLRTAVSHLDCDAEFEVDEDEEEDDIDALIPLPLAEDEGAEVVSVAVPCEQLMEELADVSGIELNIDCPDEAVNAFLARLEAAPWDADARWELAQCYAQRGSFPSAIREFHAIFESRPEYHDARKELIYCYAAMKRWEDAYHEIDYLAGIQRLHDEAESIRSLVASLQQQCGHAEMVDS